MKGNVEYIRNLQKMLDQSKGEIERLDKVNIKLEFENNNVLIKNKKLKDESKRSGDKRKRLRDEIRTLEK